MPVEAPHVVTQIHSSALNDFPRSAAWSPDGKSILCHNESRSLTVHTLSDAGETKLISQLKCPAALLTSLWYLGARIDSPATFCYLRSVRDTPIGLIDANTGKLRASWPIINHQERFIGPHSLEFSADASQLYCGHENAIEIFDFSRDGSTGSRISTSPTRKSRDGQKGLISDLAISPAMPSVLAAGSFNRSVGLYDISSPGDASCMQTFRPKGGSGVTQVKFHPTRSELYVASRRSNAIVCWDVRHAAEPLAEYLRPGSTNQRLKFDIDHAGQYLISGDQRGAVHCFYIGGDVASEPVLTWQAADDTIGSVQFNPGNGNVLTAHGSRSFQTMSDSSDESDSDNDANALIRPSEDAATGGCTVWSFSSA